MAFRLTGDENNAGQRTRPGCARKARPAGDCSSLADVAPKAQTKMHREFSSSLPGGCILLLCRAAGDALSASAPVMAATQSTRQPGRQTLARDQSTKLPHKQSLEAGRRHTVLSGLHWLHDCIYAVVVMLQPATRQSPAQTFSTPKATRSQHHLAVSRQLIAPPGHDADRQFRFHFVPAAAPGTPLPNVRIPSA